MAKQTNNTASAVVPFLFEGDGLVRVVIHDGKPWFVAADVCRAIGIKQATRAVESLDDDEKWVTSTHPFFAEKALWLICEGGLYTLILRSRAATTPGTVQHRFRKWVTAEVLPSIRKTGGYRSPPRQGLSAEERAARWDHKIALDAQRMQVNRMHAATRALDAVRRASGARAAALAAPQIYAALGIYIDPDASDTLAQGELPLDETTVH
jgi:prophage antirepressor-like protein